MSDNERGLFDEEYVRTDTMLCTQIQAGYKRDDDAPSGYVLDGTATFIFTSDNGEGEVTATAGRFFIGQLVKVRHKVGRSAYYTTDETLAVDGCAVMQEVFTEARLLEEAPE